MSSRISLRSGSENDEFSNLMRLSLNKPKEWSWELSTSKSSPNIAFPTIQLYDSHSNVLLAEAEEADCVFQGNDKLERKFVNGVEVPAERSKRKSISRSLSQSIIDSFVQQLTDQGIECTVNEDHGSRARSRTREPMEFPVPILKKSKSAVEVPRGKKPNRNASSVRFSTSFLQRVSERKEASSSDSEMELPDKRYYYRSSKAGTLLLCDSDSMRKKRRRRSSNLHSLAETEDAEVKEDTRKTRSRSRRRRSKVGRNDSSSSDTSPLKHGKWRGSVPQDTNKEIVRVNSNNVGKPSFGEGVNSDEVLRLLVKRLADLNHHYPGRSRSKKLNDDDEYLLDDIELLKKLRYSATVADLSSTWTDKINNNQEADFDFTAQSGEKGHEMGSNVSRYSEKGLSGRRAHSSGNICNDSTATTTPKKSSSGTKKGRKAAKNASSSAITNNQNFLSIDDDTSSIVTAAYDNASFTDPCIVNDISLQQLYSPYNARKQYGESPRHRLAYHGSLPNNLDTDDMDSIINQQRAVVNTFYSKQDQKLREALYESGGRAPGSDDTPKHNEHIVPQQYQHLYQSNNMPFKHSSSGKGSSISSNNLGTSNRTLQNNQDNSLLKDQLYLPLRELFPANNIIIANDAGYDQGYASERSPEEEMPPALALIDGQQYLQNMQVMEHYPPYQQQPHELSSALPMPYGYSLDTFLDFTQLYQYDFITKDTIFPVYIAKGPRGLGLSVSGGSDSTAPFPGLIRIKRLFPHQAAWSTGVLQPGDIILAVDGVQLTGLTNYEALEILRTTPNEVHMIVCRPHDERYRKLSPPAAQPPQPPLRRTGSRLLETPTLFENAGEFEVFLTKQQGSLGFTLRKEDESLYGHCIRALVRDPALSDGRLKPGDKIIAVNDIPISNMTHEQAVIFLRQAPETVKLRLFRDESLTPLSAVSPTKEECDSGKCLKKVILRPEAINLLTDIAYRKQQNSGGDDSTSSSLKSSNASPRRLRRVYKSNHSCNTFTHSGTCENTDSDTSTVTGSSKEATFRVQQTSSNSSVSFANNGVVSEPDEDEEEFYNEEELLAMVEDESYYGERPANRPHHLDLNATQNSEGCTPVVSKKPQFQFSIATANAYELNNLDNQILDAPTIYTLVPKEPIGEAVDDFTSLPCETFLVACKTEKDLEQCSEYVSKFKHKNPSYQSAQFCSTSEESQEERKKDEGGKSLLKWKGIMLSPDKSTDDKTPSAESCNDCVTVISNTMTNSNSSLNYQLPVDSDGNQIITIEMERGWNSRLGFSLASDESNGIFISTIYPDSVAARDGRLRVGDQILAVNDDSVEKMTKSEVVDFLRILRGPIRIVIQRKAHHPPYDAITPVQ